jgi:hypothetical protein
VRFWKAQHFSWHLGLSRHSLSTRSLPLLSCSGDCHLHGTLDCLPEVSLARMMILLSEVPQPLTEAPQSVH